MITIGKDVRAKDHLAPCRRAVSDRDPRWPAGWWILPGLLGAALMLVAIAVVAARGEPGGW